MFEPGGRTDALDSKCHLQITRINIGVTWLCRSLYMTILSLMTYPSCTEVVYKKKMSSLHGLSKHKSRPKLSEREGDLLFVAAVYPSPWGMFPHLVIEEEIKSLPWMNNESESMCNNGLALFISESCLSAIYMIIQAFFLFLCRPILPRGHCSFGWPRKHSFPFISICYFLEDQ